MGIANPIVEILALMVLAALLGLAGARFADDPNLRARAYVWLWIPIVAGLALMTWAYSTQGVAPEDREWAVFGLNVLTISVPLCGLLMLWRTFGRSWWFLIPSALVSCANAAYISLYGTMAINDVWL